MKGKAKKKPIIIDFFHWKEFSEDNIKALKEWVNSFGYKSQRDFIFTNKCNTFRIKTLEGMTYDVSDDYYIIRGVKGEFYPCEGNIFRETYEEVK